MSSVGRLTLYKHVILQILLPLTHQLPQVREVSQEFTDAVSMLRSMVHTCGSFTHNTYH